MPYSPEARAALLSILGMLEAAGYHFVTPTPATHARVLARTERREARTPRDVFGWSLPFAPGLLPPPLLDALDRSGRLGRTSGALAAHIRASRVGGALFLHSAYPTTAPDAVFLGPDSYRFAAFIDARLGRVPPRARIVDLGTGAGVGAVIAGRRHPDARLAMIDINRDALFLAAINAEHAGLAAETIAADGLSGIAGPCDVILANPPFLVDAGNRAYRHGGAMHGARLSLDWAVGAAGRLAPGGRLLLYTGSAIVAGHDALRAALAERIPPLGCTLNYRELDPDIFGEELDEPAYAAVERIAAVGVVVARPA